MTVHPATPRLHDWLRERQGEMVRFLERLARIESPSTDPATQGAVFALVTKALEEVGWTVRRISGERTGGHLFARPPKARGPDRRSGAGGANASGSGQAARSIQLVVGHVDTVWPVGTLEEMPVVEKDRTLRGPGVFDMKGGLVQLVFALRGLAALDLQPEVTPAVFLNSDEEIGSPESEEWVRRLARRSSRALVLEPALEPVGKLKTTRRGGGRFEIRVKGRSAHTGLAPAEGASAIHELSHLVQALYQLSDPDRDITVNVGEIRGGSRPNVVAPEASAVVDVRVRTRADGRWLEERIRALESMERVTRGTTVEIRGSIDRPPMEGTPRNRTLWRAAREVGGALGLDLEEGMSGGGSDGNTTSLYTATLDGLGSVGDGAHALHEYVEVDRMPERAALLGGILLLPDLAHAELDPAAEEDAAAGETAADPERRGGEATGEEAGRPAEATGR